MLCRRGIASSDAAALKDPCGFQTVSREPRDSFDRRYRGCKARLLPTSMNITKQEQDACQINTFHQQSNLPETSYCVTAVMNDEIETVENLINAHAESLLKNKRQSLDPKAQWGFYPGWGCRSVGFRWHAQKDKRKRLRCPGRFTQGREFRGHMENVPARSFVKVVGDYQGHIPRLARVHLQ